MTDDCVWLKWHGELYGYPDIHPSDLKKYLESSEWSTVSTLLLDCDEEHLLDLFSKNTLASTPEN